MHSLKVVHKLLFFILVLCSENIVAQKEWAPQNATWYYNQKSLDSGNQDYWEITSFGDTLINNKQCKKLYEKFYNKNGEGQSFGPYFLFADQFKVYLFQDDQFKLLYDFEATKGDTVYITAHIANSFCDSTVLVIDSVSYTDIDGDNYKTLHHHSLSNCSYGDKSIEYIGGIGYFFPFYVAADPVPGDLRCYHDSFFSYNNNWNLACDTLLTSINLKSNGIDIKCYPNPISDKLYVRFAHKLQHKLEIRTIHGALKYKNTFWGDELYINTNDWENGVYFVVIDNHYSTKIIKY